MPIPLEELIPANRDIQIASIISNGVIRVLGICAGAFIVWMGHTSLLQGVKGEFQFDGKMAKLKGSAPGLLFVLLGSSAVGWSLNTRHEGGMDVQAKSTQEAEGSEASFRSSTGQPSPESPSQAAADALPPAEWQGPRSGRTSSRGLAADAPPPGMLMAPPAASPEPTTGGAEQPSTAETGP
ncbi:MAG: hypothetical protein AAF799_22320 [Myxococcota bacterium]